MGGKTSTTTQQVQIPKEVMDRYNAVNTRAEGLGDTPFKQYSTDPAAFVAQLNEQQLAGTNQINASAGAYQPYFAQAGEAMRAGMGSAQPGELNLGQFYNPYQQQVIDATMKQMGQANEQAQSGALGTAISSGAFGGDRAGIAAANLANQQGLAMGSTLAGLNAQNYNQALAAAQQQQGVQLGATQADLARLMQGGQFYAGLGSAAQQAGIQGGEAMLNAGTLGQQTEQAGLSALYNQFQQQQAYPFQIAQFLANIAMGTGALSGSTTATTQPSSFWSDRRLKHDIKRIGTSDNGLPVYTFKYKGDDTEQTHVGYMADEVEKKHPDAVGVAGNGYKYVDYDRASRAEGGGVAGPYGAAFGSQDPYAAGYVPQAVLPIGQLITADPALLQQAEQSLAEQLQAANQFGENISGLKDKYDAVRGWWNGEDPDTGPQRTADSGKVANARGGVVAYASGGPAYLSAGVAGRQNPVEKSTYLTDTLDSQGKRDDELMRPNSSPERQKSGLENVVDLGKMAMTLFGFERGGRAGYAPGGMADEEEARRKLLLNELPQPQTLGSLPNATVTPVSDARPMPRPEGLAAASVAPEIPATRPMARPAGLVPPSPEATSVAADTLAALGRGNAVQTAAPAVTSPGVAGARTNTGVAPQGGYAPVVPLKTQLNFVTHELQKPEYDDYLKTSYESPAQAAIAFDTIYERSGGAGNDRAAAYAEDVYAAASSGDFSNLSPNAATAYTHFIETGMDPVQAAGATGRLMVESYARMDPNARNTLNGGNGTYGIAQWRGDRMEELANFSGVPLDAITSAPVSTPEGRYYTSTSGGTSGGVGDMSLSTAGAPTAGAEASMNDRLMGVVPMGGDKPYDERSRLGQMFYDENGRVNKDALLSILSGIGTMASSPSRYLGASILQGIGGAANTYMARQEQMANIRKMDADTASAATQLVKNSIFQDPMTQESYIYLQNGGAQRFTDWLTNPAAPSAAGVEGDRILRQLAGAATGATGQSGSERPFQIDATPVDPSATISQPAPTGAPAAGMPVQPIQTAAISTGTFPITDGDRAIIDRNTQTLRNMTPVQREAALLASEQQRTAATAESTAASGAFRNLNELGYVLAKASQGDMGPLGSYKAAIGGLLEQVAVNLGVEYTGDAASNAALLNKLALLQADQMTADTAAAQLFLQNKNIFPTIESNPTAAAEISAAMYVDNMADYEFGQFANDFYANHGPFKSMDGARQLFVQKSGNTYQTEKTNISTLLQAASDPTLPKELRDAVTMFLDEANSGAFRSPQDAQEALNVIFDAMPGERDVSSGLGRYFVR